MQQRQTDHSSQNVPTRFHDRVDLVPVRRRRFAIPDESNLLDLAFEFGCGIRSIVGHESRISDGGGEESVAGLEEDGSQEGLRDGQRRM